MKNKKFVQVSTKEILCTEYSNLVKLKFLEEYEKKFIHKNQKILNLDVENYNNDRFDTDSIIMSKRFSIHTQMKSNVSDNHSSIMNNSKNTRNYSNPYNKKDRYFFQSSHQ